MPEHPSLELVGRLLMEQVRDPAIRDMDRLLDRPGASLLAAKVKPLLAALDPDQVAVVRRLIPVVVDATLHHLLWTLEQWPEVHLGVTLPVEAVSDVRQVALGDLQGYLYDWIPRFSQEAHDPTTLEQGEP
jgi:hypothetical protein